MDLNLSGCKFPCDVTIDGKKYALNCEVHGGLSTSNDYLTLDFNISDNSLEYLKASKKVVKNIDANDRNETIARVKLKGQILECNGVFTKYILNNNSIKSFTFVTDKYSLRG